MEQRGVARGRRGTFPGASSSPPLRFPPGHRPTLQIYRPLGPASESVATLPGRDRETRTEAAQHGSPDPSRLTVPSDNRGDDADDADDASPHTIRRSMSAPDGRIIPSRSVTWNPFARFYPRRARSTVIDQESLAEQGQASQEQPALRHPVFMEDSLNDAITSVDQYMRVMRTLTTYAQIHLYPFETRQTISLPHDDIPTQEQREEHERRRQARIAAGIADSHAGVDNSNTLAPALNADGTQSHQNASPQSPSLPSDVQQYLVLPADVNLDDWSESEISRLNEYVGHMLNSRRSKLSQTWKAFLAFASTLRGFLTTLYFALIFLFGLAWVLFLIGWVNVGGKQLFAINVIDHVLVALFAVMGIGSIPFRVRDTYRMFFIIHYARISWKIREERKLPGLKNKYDLPEELDPDRLVTEPYVTPPLTASSQIRAYFPRLSMASRRRASVSDDSDSDRPPPGLEKVTVAGSKSFLLRRKRTDDPTNPVQTEPSFPEYSVLKPHQQTRLHYHQAKFQIAHGYYRPHETPTHRAFSLKFLFWIVFLLDMHSVFQLALGLCTWIIDYRVRPTSLTTVLLCLSLGVNILSMVLISIGTKRACKPDSILWQKKQTFTQHAIHHIEKRRQVPHDEAGHTGPPVSAQVDGQGEVQRETTGSTAVSPRDGSDRGGPKDAAQGKTAEGSDSPDASSGSLREGGSTPLPDLPADLAGETAVPVSEKPNPGQS